MRLFHKDKPIFGLDISTTGIKVMAVDHKKLQVVGYASVDLDPAKVQVSMLKSDNFLADALKGLLKDKLVGHLHGNGVVASVPTSRAYGRVMTIPVEAEKNLAGAVQLEVERYIPIAASELSIDYEVIERGSTELTILLAAVPKQIVDMLLATCRVAGLEVVMIEPALYAAARLIKATEEGHLPSIIIDIGAATSDMGILDNGFVRLTSSVAIGGHTFTLKMSEGLKVSLEEAHQLKVHNGLGAGPHREKIKIALQSSLDLITSEIHKLIRYYNERVGIKTKIEQIIIVGGGSNIPGIGEAITESMNMPARVGNPWQSLQYGKLTPPGKQFKSRFVTAAGLAIVEPKEIWQ